jgi:hypothetical protein
MLEPQCLRALWAFTGPVTGIAFSLTFTCGSNRFSHHLQTSNILAPEQFGFRKGIFTENAVIKLTDNVLKFINKEMHVG